MSARLRAHIRSNVIGYVAIFLFAVGGTASATHPGGANTISSGDIIDDEVFTDDVADDTVAGGGLGHPDLRVGSVRAPEIANGEVTTSEVLDDTEAGGGLGALDLAANAVGISEIADNAVESSEIADNAVGSSEIIISAVASGEIATDGVTASEVAPNAIDADEIEDASVGSAEIATSGVGSAEIAVSAVGSEEVGTNALRLGDLAIGITDESTANLAGTVNAGSCSAAFNDGLEFGDAPIGSHTLAYHVRRSNGSPNPGWTIDGATTTTTDAGRVRFCNNTGSNADPPELTYSYMTIAP